MSIFQDTQKLNELNDAMGRHRDLITDIENEQSRLAQKFSMLDKTASNYSAAVKDLNRQYDNLESKKNVVKESLKGWEGARRTLQNIQGELEGVDKRMSALSSAKTKSVAEYVSHSKEISKAFRAEIDQLKARGVIGEAMYKQLMSLEGKYHEKALKGASERTKLLHKMKTGTGEEKKEAQREWSKEFFGSVGAMAGGITGAIGMKSKTLGAMGGAFKGGYGSMERVREGFKGFKGMAKDAGGGIKILSGGLKALGTALKGLNWIGMLVGTIKAAVKMINELDKFMKELNNTWRSMAGSIVLMDDVGRSMKKFNDAIFDVSRNMRLGLKASEIQDFFKAMSAGGLSLEGVAKRAGDYNSVIEQGFKLSRQFGVSFSEMGQMMSKQMMNLRSSLDDVSDAFKNVSYDAAMAGINSQKFYQAVESASMSLSFYGNYLASASDMLRTFTETGTMGFKDAAETVQTAMGTIKGMGMDQRRQLVNILGEDEIIRMMNERVEKMDEAIEKQSFKIEGMESRGASPEELKAARLRLHAAKMDRRNLKETIRTGDISALAGMMEVISDRAPEMARKVLEAFNVDPFEEKAAAYETLSKTMRWNQDMVNKMTKRANVSLSLMRSELGYFSKALKDRNIKEGLVDVANKVHFFFNHPEKSVLKSLDHVVEYARETLGKDMEGEQLERVISMVQELGPAFSSYVKGVYNTIEGEGPQISERLMKRLSLWASTFMPEGKELDISETRLAQMVEKTTPIAKYLEIGKENVKYALAGSDLMANISVASAETAKNTGSILQEIIQFFSRWGKKRKSEEEFQRGEGGKIRAKYKGLAEKRMMAPHIIAQMKEAGATPKEIEEAERKINEIREAMEDMEHEYRRIPSSLKEVRSEARESADVQVKSLQKAKSEIDEWGSAIEEMKNASESFKQQYGEHQYWDTLEEMVRQYNIRVKGWNELLERATTTTKMALVEGRKPWNVEETYTEVARGTLGVEGKSIPRGRPRETASEAIERLAEKHDFLVKKGGLVNLKKGDIAIDSASLAKGLSMGAGQLMDHGPGIMKGGAAGGLAMNGVTLNFNAPMEGKPEEYRRVFVEAVEDVVNRMKYKDNMRV